MYTGAFVGALLGFFLSGLLSDPIAKYLSKLNHGVYEPEFRLSLIIPQTIFGVIGLLGFGWTAQDPVRFGTSLPSFFFGLEVTGMVLGATASALYLVDAYRDLAVESFTCLLLFKNFFAFALTWKAVFWVTATGIGPWRLFWILALLQFALGLMSIPMCELYNTLFLLFLFVFGPADSCVCVDVFGKRNRSFMHRHDILKLTGLR